MHAWSPYAQVSPIVDFKGDGTYCFTILANGIVTEQGKCANNDVKKFEIRSCESSCLST